MRKIVWEPRNRTLEQGRSEEGLVEAVVKEGGLLGEEGLKQQFSNGGEEELRRFMVQEVTILKDAGAGFLVLVCGFGKGIGEQSSNAAAVVWRALQYATGGIEEDLTRELDTSIDNTSTSFSSSTGSSSSASSSSRSSSNASTISSPLPSHMLTPTTFATPSDSRAYFTSLLSSSVEKISVKAGALPYILSPGFGEYTDCVIGISAHAPSSPAHALSSPAHAPSPPGDSSGSLDRDEPSPSVRKGLEWGEPAVISIFGPRGEVRRVVPVLCPVAREAVPAAALEKAIREEEDVRGGRVVVMRHGRFQEGEVECVRKVLGRFGARGTFVEVGESGRCRLFRALPPFAESMPAAAAEGAPPAAAKGAAVAAAAEGAAAEAAAAAAAAAEEDVYFPLSNTSAALVASSIARGMPQPISVEIRENDLGLCLQQVVTVVAGMRRVQHGALGKAKLPGAIHCAAARQSQCGAAGQSERAAAQRVAVGHGGRVHLPVPVVLLGNLNVQLPNAWLWDMVDEFIYQFQSFCHFRARVKSRTDEENAALKQCGNVWNVYGVLNYLHALVAKSNILAILDDDSDGGAAAMFLATEGYDMTGAGGSNVERVLGYLSLVGLLRVHCLLGDYHTGLVKLSPIDVGRPGVFQRITGCHITAMYYYGFASLMLRRYVDAIRAFNQVLLTLAKAKQYHESLPQYDQILKKTEQMFALLAICLSLCPNGKLLEESVNGQLREKFSDKIQRMQRGDEAVFDELFSFACPKFVTPAPPVEDGGELVNYNQDAYRLQLKLFLADVRSQLALPGLRSALSLYSAISLPRLSTFLDVSETTLRTALITLRHKNTVVEGDGSVLPNAELDFYIDDDLVQVVDRKTTRRFGDYFIKHILKFDELAGQLENPSFSQIPPTSRTPCSPSVPQTFPNPTHRRLLPHPPHPPLPPPSPPSPPTCFVPFTFLSAPRLLAPASPPPPSLHLKSAKMPFRRYMEVGRVCMVNFGPMYGKLVVVVDIIDQNRALIDFTGMERQQINYKRLSLTDITIDIPKAASKKELRAAIEAGEVQSKWEASSWGRKLLIQKKRAALTDFERFKIAAARSQKAKAVKKALA
ncbi:unnamed protein product [Closterium sp. Naga37s-1]|nr:unnamed protein product [Closterium sp. Naga37s-1]